MPELPEVQALVAFLRERAVGAVVAAVEVGAISVLKTYDPPPTALAGLEVTGVHRFGKWVDLDVSGLHLVFHLSKAGWLRWSDALAPAPVRPGKSPIALRVRLDGASPADPAKVQPDRLPGFDLTEAGTKKRLAVHVVRDPAEIERIASLGPDPLDDGFDRAALARAAHRREQAGQGAAARPERAGRRRQRLQRRDPARGAAVAVRDRVQARRRAGRPAARGPAHASSTARWPRPAASRPPSSRTPSAAGMAVHGRTGQTCPVCGDTVREVSFADSSLQYCATCQTGGKPLADRRLSRLLK